MTAPGIEPDTVTHLSTNRVRRRLTSLIKANVLTTTPDRQKVTHKYSSLPQPSGVRARGSTAKAPFVHFSRAANVSGANDCCSYSRTKSNVGLTGTHHPNYSGF